MKLAKDFVAFAIAMSLIASPLLTGCSGGGQEPQADQEPSTEAAPSGQEEFAADQETVQDDSAEQDSAPEEDATVESETNAVETEVAEQAVTTTAYIYPEDLSDEQIGTNSLAMLNYLTVLSQDVIASKDSKLKLEVIYDDLFNNTRPDMIDKATHDRIVKLADTIEAYRMLDVKRERIQYLYEQQKAAAVQEAMPDPEAVIVGAIKTGGNVFQIAKLAYETASNSQGAYEAALKGAELEYLATGWELDDELATEMHNQRKDSFNYMFDMVNSYDLPGDLALTEKAVANLVDWKNNPNTVGRIQFLESNVDTYKGYGGYWLLLAQSYFESGSYQKCVDAMSSYESMRSGMLRKDHEYASTLPVAIAAAAETMDQDSFVQYASTRADEIVKNSEDTDWDLRYAAALIDVNLHSITGDETYLKKAYSIELDNVNTLVATQGAQNAEYLKAFKEAKAPKGATKEQKDEVKAFNKSRKAEHNASAAPIYQPLFVNCDMLFALADALEVDNAERARINGVLHPNDAPIFLEDALDQKYRMDGNGSASDDYEVKMAADGTEVVLPATAVSDYSNVTVTVDEGALVPGEWKVSSVKRGTEGDVSTFVVTLKNADAKGSYPDGSTATVTISEGRGESAISRSYDFVASVDGRFFLPDAVSFERA